MRNIDLIREVTSAAAGRWPYVLAGLSIDVPDSSRRHSPCPACGGKDRFRFDDNGRGSFICNQCGAGDGLDLIKKVNNCDTTEAAQLAADVLGIDYRAAETDPVAASHRREQLEADRQQREQERQKQAAEDAEQRRATFARLYAGMRQSATQGESDYLQSKGLTGFNYPVMPDGSLLLELVDESGAVAAAQTITPQGEKRLLTGSAKRGAYHAVNAPEQPQSVLIAEGLATALSVHLMRPDALTVAAIDAGNLLPVAGVMRRKHPQSQIIIAADNDHQQDEQANTGKDAAEKAALSVAGWVALPPTDYKADWDDYRQQNGLEVATAAFNDSMYQLRGKGAQVKNHKQPIWALNEISSGEVLSDDEIAVLEEINRTFTHVTIGGKHKVVSLKPSQAGGVSHVFEDLSQFHHYFHHKPRVARKLAGSAWLSWSGKNYKPGGVGFYPVPDKCPDDVFNLYEGLALEPIEGDCTVYLNHLLQVVCAGNEEAYQYLIQWMAHIIQKPDEKPSVAIVMKSVPGTGKGTTVKPLLQILGQYAAHINGAGHISGRFNSILANKLLVFADEVTIHKPSEADRLKAIISEPTFNLERKGIDAEPMPNFARLIFASNSTQVLQAGIRERRYLVLEPSPEKAQSREYFDRLYSWLNDGGAAKLLWHLKGVDLSGFDPQRAPQTDALREEILLGLSGVELFLYGELINEPPFNGEVRLFAKDMVNRFVAWSLERGEKLKEPAARSLLGKSLAQMGLVKHGRPDRGNGVFYELPEVGVLQAAFARLIGMEGYDVF
ncbi:TPA: helicase [Escherichia coli]|nr:toprim domain-containing protein [Escherichia coli]HAX6708990.1 helicase [Escherichia coli]HAX7241390.1 helicase [Escherichia coli]